MSQHHSQSTVLLMGFNVYRLPPAICERVIDRIRLGSLDVSLCVVEPAFTEIQLRQCITNPKQVIVSIEKRASSKWSIAFSVSALDRAWLCRRVEITSGPRQKCNLGVVRVS